MAGSTRNHQPHGRTIRCAGGDRAFLPPPIEWNGTLVAALSHADLAVGRLAGEGRRLPDPHLFIRSFIRREAVLSSRIEGTRTTLAELLAVEAGAKGTADSADLHEVADYVAALEHGLDRLDTLPLSLRLIRELHERLMRGVRGGAATPGAFRRSQNWIGPPGCTLNDASYIPPGSFSVHASRKPLYFRNRQATHCLALPARHFLRPVLLVITSHRTEVVASVSENDPSGTWSAALVWGGYD